MSKKNLIEKLIDEDLSEGLNIKKNFVLLFALLALLFPPCLAAQAELDSFLLPRTIFVGDEARLVVTLGDAFSAVQPFVQENPANFGETFELVIRRIELERRGGISRLLIDFVPFAAGTIHFPSLDFLAYGEEQITLSGLQANVSSVLDGASMELSMPALPLAVPGTGLLIYGSIAAILAVLSLAVAISVWARSRFKGFWLALRRGHLMRAMIRFLRRIGHEGGAGKNGSPAYYLGLLAAEFREFLSDFTGKNCRSLTPAELMELPLAGDLRQMSVPSSAAAILTPAFLCRLFRNWDALRFNGFDVDKADFFQAVKETEIFVLALRERERENRRKRPAAAGGERL